MGAGDRREEKADKERVGMGWGEERRQSLSKKTLGSVFNFFTIGSNNLGSFRGMTHAGHWTVLL